MTMDWSSNGWQNLLKMLHSMSWIDCHFQWSSVLKITWLREQGMWFSWIPAASLRSKKGGREDMLYELLHSPNSSSLTCWMHHQIPNPLWMWFYQLLECCSRLRTIQCHSFSPVGFPSTIAEEREQKELVKHEVHYSIPLPEKNAE